MSKVNKDQGTKVIIPCRFSYLNCFEPQSINGSEPKYSVSAIIDKSDKVTLKKIKAAIEAAKKEAAAKWGGKIPADLTTPLKDGDIEKSSEVAYVNSYYLSAYSKQAPQVVDKHLQLIDDPSEIYSGCYGRISVTFYGYEASTRGIAAGLGNIQLLKAGEPLGTRCSAAEDFEAVSMEEDFLG